MAKPSKLKFYLRSFSYRVRDFIKYRLMVTSKQLLIIGGSDDYIGKIIYIFFWISQFFFQSSFFTNLFLFTSIATNLIKSLKPTWRVTSIDFNPSEFAHQSIIIEEKNNLDKEFENISKEIKNMNIRFDGVFCFAQNDLPNMRISDPQILASLQKYSSSTISLMLLGIF